MIVGITGLLVDDAGNKRIAGAGKDTAADRLVAKHKFVRIGLADPLKRICQDVFQFSDEQLWGPSHMREAVDKRYPRGSEAYRSASEAEEKAMYAALQADDQPSAEVHRRAAEGYAMEGWLSPRVALQSLGTEWGRWCYSDLWMEYGLRVAKRLEEGGCYYDQRMGLRTTVSVANVMEPKTDSAFSDIRFFNEFELIKAAGGVVVRVKRRNSGELPALLNPAHKSETQLVQMDDDKFDYIIDNNGTLDNLALQMDRMIDVFTGRIRPYDEVQADVPPFLRK